MISGLFVHPYMIKMIARIYFNTWHDEPTTNRGRRRVYIHQLIVIADRRSLCCFIIMMRMIARLYCNTNMTNRQRLNEQGICEINLVWIYRPNMRKCSLCLRAILQYITSNCIVLGIQYCITLYCCRDILHCNCITLYCFNPLMWLSVHNTHTASLHDHIIT